MVMNLRPALTMTREKPSSWLGQIYCFLARRVRDTDTHATASLQKANVVEGSRSLAIFAAIRRAVS
jgi:hypothetical protein